MGKKPAAAAASPPPDEKDEEEEVKEPAGELLSGDFVFPDGSVYKGQYLKTPEGDIRLHGEGWLQSGPEIFQGTFEAGLYKSGRYTSCNGAVYTGSFRENRFHGLGDYSWPDGRVYRGMWKDGFMHGRGQYQNFSYGADKTFRGYSVDGKFASSREAQERGKKAFMNEYGDDYIKSAIEAIGKMAERSEISKLWLVPPVPAAPQSLEEEEAIDEAAKAKRDRAVAERAAVEEFVAGPFPEVANVNTEALKALVAAMTAAKEPPAEGAEPVEPPRITVLEERDSASQWFVAERVRHEQLQHVGQLVEIVTTLPADPPPEPGSLRGLLLANVSQEYDCAKGKWKLVHYEVVPTPEAPP